MPEAGEDEGSGPIGSAPYPTLLSPFQLANVRLRHRIVSTGFDQEGRLTPAYVAYHVGKAEGGAGMVMAFGSARRLQPVRRLVRLGEPVESSQ
ncbi:MAG TPA: hypothetical protein VNN74_10555 [Candidatus Micrarchaeia archaeon]|nr:hypothetical protein [Candidatus Micrarchaeia archaeon]